MVQKISVPWDENWGRYWGRKNIPTPSLKSDTYDFVIFCV